MSANTRSRTDTEVDSDASERPAISVCESRPGRTVFLESGNTDGWISSDSTVDVVR